MEQKLRFKDKAKITQMNYTLPFRNVLDLPLYEMFLWSTLVLDFDKRIQGAFKDYSRIKLKIFKELWRYSISFEKFQINAANVLAYHQFTRTISYKIFWTSPLPLFVLLIAVNQVNNKH